MFVFGTQYLRGATPAEDQWERDMAHMEQMGFNTIRMWLVWNALERQEGVIDTAFVGRFLACAKRHHLQVGLLFHLHAAPAWATAKYRDYYYVDENGNAFEPAIRPNTPSGGWPGLCFDHAEVRQLEKRFITAILAETVKHDNVAFYEPMNEPHSWMNGAAFYCYCPASVQKFQAWLRQKYACIDDLNRSWGHFFHDFDEVRPPRWTAAYSCYADFRQFTIDNIADEIAWRRDVIKSMTDVPVIAHSWGGGAVTCANLGGMAFDDWKNAALFDKWGYSAFPGHADDCDALGLGCAATRCAANGKEYWQSELNAGMVGTGLFPGGRIDDATFDKFSLESLRQGAKGLLYWQFRRERHGAELGGYALTDFDGGPTNLSRRAAALCRAVTDNEDIFAHALPARPAQVALVFSMRSYLANWGNNRRDNKFAVDSMSGYHRMLWEENMPVDVIHEAFPGDLSRYKAVILPSPYAIDPALAESLKTYVQNGGTLISDPAFGLFDGEMVLSYAVPGFGFDAVFGARQEDLRQAKTVPLADGRVLVGNMQKELYRNVTANVLWRYEDGSPAVLCNAYGKGRAILCGVNVGLCYSRRTLIADDLHSTDAANSCALAKELVLSLLAEAGVTPNPCTAPGVKCSLLAAPAGTAVILINSTCKPVNGSVPVGAFAAARCVYNQAPVSLAGEQLHFSLLPDQSVVVRLDAQ